MDARHQRAETIVSGGRIARGEGCRLVPSQTGFNKYQVILDGPSPSCTCPDWELRERDCKHILAVRLMLEREKTGATQPEAPLPEPVLNVKRPTYPQDWPNYDLAQTREKGHFLQLLAELCDGISQPPPKNPQKGGRPTVLLSDATYAAVFKVYSTFSARRFMTDLRSAHEQGYLTQPLSYSTVVKALENPALTPILYGLIRESSLPLKAVEVDFAPDSSSFATSKFARWFDHKWGKVRERHQWVKVQTICGVKTNIITAAEVCEFDGADSPYLPGLVKATAENFTIREVSADKGFSTVENHDVIAEVGGVPFIAFKKNVTGASGGLWGQMFHYFSFRREDFLAHYHKRSNTESTYSMIKRKFGDSVRSKTDIAMRNEVLCKLVCHNVCCLISAIYELGINPVFWEQEQAECADILQLVRPG